MKSIITALAVVALLATGCGDGASTTTTGPDPGTTVAAGTGPEPQGITLSEPLAYTGYLYADESGVQLVKALAESYPPQPARPGQRVEGLDLSTVPGLVTHQGITWSEEPVQIFGDLVNDTIIVVAP